MGGCVVCGTLVRYFVLVGCGPVTYGDRVGFVL